MNQLPYTFQYLDLLWALSLVLAPLLTRFRKTQVLAWWLIPLWLAFTFGMIEVMHRLEPCFAVPAGALLLGLLVFAITGPQSFGFFRRPTNMNGESTAPAKTVAVCLSWGAVAIAVHFLYQEFSPFLFDKGSGIDSRSNQLLLDYLILADSSLMSGILLAGLGFLVAVCVPIASEVTCRGFLQSWLDARLKRWLAVLITATIFGSLHGLGWAMPAVFLGALASWLTFRFHSLMPAIFLHAIHNGGVLIASVVWIWSGHDDRFQQLESQRIAQVKKDQEDAELVRRFRLITDHAEAYHDREVYEPKLRAMMEGWGLSTIDQGHVLDLWEKSSLDVFAETVWVSIDTPAHLGDRRNAWRNRAWEKHRQQLRLDIRAPYERKAIEILGDAKRLQQLNAARKEILAERDKQEEKEREVEKKKTKSHPPEAETAPKADKPQP